MGKLKNSTIKVPTIRGVIKGEYQFVNPRLETFTIEIPANMVAEFELTDIGSKEVKLNGKKASTAFGVIQLMPGINRIDLVVNSF
jgi:hypothetical protein